MKIKIDEKNNIYDFSIDDKTKIDHVMDFEYKISIQNTATAKIVVNQMGDGVFEATVDKANIKIESNDIQKFPTHILKEELGRREDES